MLFGRAVTQAVSRQPLTTEGGFATVWDSLWTKWYWHVFPVLIRFSGQHHSTVAQP
jgi:hypothetical protein